MEWISSIPVFIAFDSACVLKLVVGPAARACFFFFFYGGVSKKHMVIPRQLIHVRNKYCKQQKAPYRSYPINRWPAGDMIQSFRNGFHARFWIKQLREKLDGCWKPGKTKPLGLARNRLRTCIIGFRPSQANPIQSVHSRSNPTQFRITSDSITEVWNWFPMAC